MYFIQHQSINRIKSIKSIKLNIFTVLANICVLCILCLHCWLIYMLKLAWEVCLKLRSNSRFFSLIVTYIQVGLDFVTCTTIISKKKKKHCNIRLLILNVNFHFMKSFLLPSLNKVCSYLFRCTYLFFNISNSQISMCALNMHVLTSCNYECEFTCLQGNLF